MNNLPKKSPQFRSITEFNHEELGKVELVPIDQPIRSVLDTIKKFDDDKDNKETKQKVIELAYQSLITKHFKFFLYEDIFYAIYIYGQELMCIRAQLVADSDFMSLFVIAVQRYIGFYVRPDYFITNLQIVRMQCKLDRQTATVFKRRAGSVFGDNVYFCLGDGNVAVITDKGIDVVPSTKVPVIFRTPEMDYNQPYPDLDNADHTLLYKHLNLKGEGQQLLLLAVLAYSIAGESGYPVLFFQGDAGSGKTEACRMSVSLLDNGSDTIRHLTSREEDFKLGCFNRHLVAYDNITGFNTILCSLICICVTTGNVTCRMLYECTKEQKILLNNPLFFTAINIPALPADVVDRALYIRFERFSDTERKSKNQLYEAFSEDAEAIVGGILILISKTMQQLKTFVPTTTTRLADFSIFGQALAMVLGKSPEDFLNACLNCESEMSLDVVEGDIVLTRLMDFVSKMECDEWVGTAAALSDMIKPRGSIAGWPKDASAFGRVLQKYKTTLLNFGVQTESTTAYRRRALKVTRLPNFVKRVSTPTTQVTQSRPERKR